MLYYGLKIDQPADPLFPMQVADLYRSVTEPKPHLQQAVDQLRFLKTVDEVRFKKQKKMLPYFVCGVFKPAIRRRQNFCHLQHFVVDLDHVTTLHNITALKQRLKADERIMMMFLSPGGDGLKILFRLSHSCHDSAAFSVFYKAFLLQWAAQHGLQGCIDAATCDVTRACFLSVDNEAYYNEDALAIDWQHYLQRLELPETKEELKQIEQKLNATAPEAQTATGQELSADVLAAIRQKLNPAAVRPQKSYFVPQEIEQFIQNLPAALEALGMKLVETAPIQYGRKLKISAGRQWAEVNVFYGKKGFSYVKTTKTGSNAELATLAVQALMQYEAGGLQP